MYIFNYFLLFLFLKTSTDIPDNAAGITEIINPVLILSSPLLSPLALTLPLALLSGPIADGDFSVVTGELSFSITSVSVLTAVVTMGSLPVGFVLAAPVPIALVTVGLVPTVSVFSVVASLTTGSFSDVAGTVGSVARVVVLVVPVGGVGCIGHVCTG